MIKKLTISSLIITVIFGFSALIFAPFAVRSQIDVWENEYGYNIIYKTVKNVSVEGIKYVNITSHEENQIHGSVYQTNDDEIKIYYKGFTISKPLITEKRDGETLDLQIDFEHQDKDTKNLLNFVLDNGSYLNVDIYIPKDIAVTLYTNNFYPRNADFTDGKQILAANGKVYGERNELTAQEYFDNLKDDYSVDQFQTLSTNTAFESLTNMMSDTFYNYDINNLKKPIMLGVKDLLLEKMESTLRTFAEENSDICPDEFAIDNFVTCGKTYINSQIRFSLSCIKDNRYNDNDILDEFEENSDFYSMQLKTSIQQFFQAKEDFMHSMQTSIVSRKNDIVNMLTFI